MLVNQKEKLQQDIAAIISQSRFGAEMFLIDYDLAAQRIFEYLQTYAVAADTVITMDVKNNKAA